MRPLRVIAIGTALVGLGIGVAEATVLNTGIDTNKKLALREGGQQVGVAPVRVADACPMLWFDADESPGEVDRLRSLGLDITTTQNPADINTANLGNFGVLVVAYTGSVPGVQAAIQQFVDSGHALLIHQPNNAGAIDYAPAGFEVDVTDSYWCGSGVEPRATIVDPSHPVTAGLSDDDLSGAFDLVGSIGPAFTVLARNVGCGDPALAAGTSGSGRVIFEDGNAGSLSIDPGSDRYWTQVFTWLCEASGNQPPDCSNALASIVRIWPPDHQMVNVDIVGVTDPDGDPMTITITGITQDEPVNGLGDGNTGPDGAGVGTSTAQLRAERAGTPKVPGNGRVYVISFSAADGRGGECRGRVPVCVPHDQSRGHVCIDDGQNFDSTVGSAPLRRVGSGSDNALGVEVSPNPFNPATTIHYVIPVTSRVGVMVYNTSGRLVRVLVDAEQSAGNQSVQWDGRDDLGRAVPSGIYLCRLHAGEVKETKRMLLLK